MKYTLETQQIIKKKIDLFSNVLFCEIKQNCFFNVYLSVNSKFQILVAT
jgi:hypothetical protein